MRLVDLMAENRIRNTDVCKVVVRLGSYIDHSSLSKIMLGKLKPSEKQALNIERALRYFKIAQGKINKIPELARLRDLKQNGGAHGESGN